MLQKRLQFFTNFCFKLAIFNKKGRKTFFWLVTPIQKLFLLTAFSQLHKYSKQEIK